MAGWTFEPAIVLAGLFGALAVAFCGIVVAPPTRHLVYLLPAGLGGAIAGQLLSARLDLPGPSVGGLYLLEALLGAWLLVLFVRRLVV